MPCSPSSSHPAAAVRTAHRGAWLAGAAGLLLGLVVLPGAGAQSVLQQKPQGYVSDLAGVLDANSKTQLTALCTEVDKKAQAQIAVVTVRSLEGQPVEVFSERLATRWGVGHKGSDRGVLVLLAVSDREYRIEVGYGLEPILPDGKVGGFGREMVPWLRQGNYGGALLHVTQRIAQTIAQDRGVVLSSQPAARAPPPAPASAPQETTAELIFALGYLFLFLLLLVWLGHKFGNVWIPAAFSLSSRSHGRSRSSWSSGSSSGSSGGFGGFGGGSFGGGGASGKW